MDIAHIFIIVSFLVAIFLLHYLSFTFDYVIDTL